MQHKGYYIFGYEKCSRSLQRVWVYYAHFTILLEGYAFYYGRNKKRFCFYGGVMPEKRLTKDDTLALLRDKYAELQSSGDPRFPRRSDFSDREVVAVKAFLGPWPRALEAAGIKAPRMDDHKEKNREKRIRAKRNRIAALKKEKKASDSGGDDG